MEQAKAAIEHHLTAFLEDPEVSVDVYAYNSKVYYVITEGGERETRSHDSRSPATRRTGCGLAARRNEWPVFQENLDRASDTHTWSRPSSSLGLGAITGARGHCDELPVMPGDRIFIAEDEWVAFDTRMAKFVAPIERAAGFSLLMVERSAVLPATSLGGGAAQNNGGLEAAASEEE